MNWVLVGQNDYFVYFRRYLDRLDLKDIRFGFRRSVQLDLKSDELDLKMVYCSIFPRIPFSVPASSLPGRRAISSPSTDGAVRRRCCCCVVEACVMRDSEEDAFEGTVTAALTHTLLAQRQHYMSCLRQLTQWVRIAVHTVDRLSDRKPYCFGRRRSSQQRLRLITMAPVRTSGVYRFSGASTVDFLSWDRPVELTFLYTCPFHSLSLKVTGCM